MAGIDPNVFALADNPNTYTPLGRGDERIVRPAVRAVDGR